MNEDKCKTCGHEEDGHTKKYGCIRQDSFPTGIVCPCKEYKL